MRNNSEINDLTRDTLQDLNIENPEIFHDKEYRIERIIREAMYKAFELGSEAKARDVINANKKIEDKERKKDDLCLNAPFRSLTDMMNGKW